MLQGINFLNAATHDAISLFYSINLECLSLFVNDEDWLQSQNSQAINDSFDLTSLFF